MADRYLVPKHLDDPELIGLWTLDEFLALLVPFVWGILSQHIFIGIACAGLFWFGLRKAKSGRTSAWLAHAAYWHLPGRVFALRLTPPSHCRRLAG